MDRCVSEKFASVEEHGWEAAGRGGWAKSRLVAYRRPRVFRDREEFTVRGESIPQKTKGGCCRVGVLSRL